MDALSNLKAHYVNRAIRDKKQLISSIFLEKFEFDGKKCRTTRINDVLRNILLIDNDLQNKKSGQLSKKIELSTLVESPRLAMPNSFIPKLQMQFAVFSSQTHIYEKIHSSKLGGFLSFTSAIKLRLMWSRRESNSGPNKQLKSFLHAYFLIRFSIS